MSEHIWKWRNENSKENPSDMKDFERMRKKKIESERVNEKARERI